MSPMAAGRSSRVVYEAGDTFHHITLTFPGCEIVLRQARRERFLFRRVARQWPGVVAGTVLTSRPSLLPSVVP